MVQVNWYNVALKYGLTEERFLAMYVEQHESCAIWSKVTYTRAQLYKAINDEGWQGFRQSLKGLPTADKIQKLRGYWEAHSYMDQPCTVYGDDCDGVCIRVDNYIKALCRGGQLPAGESLESMLTSNWKPVIRR
jgi:hypothetical protein